MPEAQFQPYWILKLQSAIQIVELLFCSGRKEARWKNDVCRTLWQLFVNIATVGIRLDKQEEKTVLRNFVLVHPEFAQEVMGTLYMAL